LLPQEFSRVCWYFLQKSGNKITCIVNLPVHGDRRQCKLQEDGLIVPFIYFLRRNTFGRVITLFAKLKANANQLDSWNTQKEFGGNLKGVGIHLRLCINKRLQ